MRCPFGHMPALCVHCERCAINAAVPRTAPAHCMAERGPRETARGGVSREARQDVLLQVLRSGRLEHAHRKPTARPA
eukprot:10518-Alexandrium_andersonii.AAC.1